MFFSNLFNIFPKGSKTMNIKEIIKNAISEIIDSTNSERACIRHESSIYIEGTNIRVEFALTPIKDTKKVYFNVIIGKTVKEEFYTSFSYIPYYDVKSLLVEENIKRFTAKVMREAALRLQKSQETFIDDFASFIEKRVEAKKEG
jgi:hypothetical protein